jgi:hypothetical protein
MLWERNMPYMRAFLDLHDLRLLPGARKIEHCVLLRLPYDIYTRSWGWLSLEPCKERSPTEHPNTFIECGENLVQSAVVLEYLKVKLSI